MANASFQRHPSITWPFSKGRRLELIFLFGALSAFAPLGIDMYLPAFPQIAKELGVPIGSVQTTLASFFIGFAGGQAIYGPVSDRFGRRMPLFAGLALYIAASIGCALSSDIGGLTLFRFFQAVGACSGGVLARATVRDIFPADEAPRFFSMMATVIGATPLLAPLAGAYIMLLFPWRAIFWFQAGIGVLAFLLVWFRVKESHGGSNRSLHPAGIFLDYVRLLIDRRFAGYVLAASLGYCATFMYLTGASHVYIDVLHVSPQTFAWFFCINGIGMMAWSQLVARLLKRYSPMRVMVVAQMLQIVAGFVLITLAYTGAGLWPLTAGFFCYLGFNNGVAPTSMAMALRPFPHQAGLAASLFGMMQFGIASIGAMAIASLEVASAVPLAVGMTACVIGGFLVNIAINRRQVLN